MKKWILGLSATAAVATPLIAVVSCGTHKEANKQTESTDKPEVVVDHAPTQTGVQPQRPAMLPQEGVATVATPEELAAKAQEAIALIDKGLAAQAAAAQVAEDNAYWNAHPSMKYVKQGAKEVLHHETMIEAIEAMDKTLSAQAEASRKAELEAIALHDRVEAQTQADAKEWNSMFRVDNILETAKGYLKYFLQDSSQKITNDQLAKFIFAIDDFVEAQEDGKDIILPFQVLAETLIELITPVQIPQLTPTIVTPQAIYGTDGKLVATHAYSDISNKAGDVVEVIKTLLLQKHSANELLKAESGGIVGFPAYNNLKAIQNDVRNILLQLFPAAEAEIKALPAEALYYAEKGGTVFGIKFQLLDYLLNPANKEVSHFSDFARAKWTRDEAETKFYDIDFVGTSNLARFNQNDYGQVANQDVAISNFLKALDKHIYAKTFGENISQEQFKSAISKFNPTIDNLENIKAVEWVLKAKGTVFTDATGVKYTITSAEVDKNDLTQVHLNLVAQGNQYTVPAMIERTIMGFKRPSDHSFDIVWTQLKDMIPATIVSASSQKTAANYWQNVAKNVVKLLEEKYPSLKSKLDATLVHLDVFDSPTKIFWGVDGQKGFLGMIKRLSAASFAEIKTHVADESSRGNQTYFTTRYTDSIKMVKDLLDALDAASKA